VERDYQQIVREISRRFSTLLDATSPHQVGYTLGYTLPQRQKSAPAKRAEVLRRSPFMRRKILHFIFSLNTWVSRGRSRRGTRGERRTRHTHNENPCPEKYRLATAAAAKSREPYGTVGYCIRGQRAWSNGIEPKQRAKTRDQAIHEFEGQSPSAQPVGNYNGRLQSQDFATLECDRPETC